MIEDPSNATLLALLPPQQSKSQLRISAVSAVPRDPRDVRSGDADIGQFAVAELVELFQARVVAPPSAEEVDDCDQHGCYLSPGPGPGNLESRDK